MMKQATASSGKYYKIAITAFTLATIFYFYEFLIQVSPNVMAQDVIEHFHVNASQFASLVTWYYIAYAMMQVPAGALFDRFGAKVLLPIAALLCTAGTLLFAFTDSFFVLQISRFLTGLGSAFALLGTLFIAATWFPPHRFAILSGTVITIGMLGAVAGEKPLALMLENFGWQHTLLILFAAGAFLSVLLFVVIRDKPVEHKREPEHLLKGASHVVSNFQSWLVAVYGLLIYGVTATLGTAWGASFLSASYNMSTADAGGYISMIYAGWALGSPIFGFISDAMRRRKPTLYFSAAASFVFLAIVVFIPHLSHWSLILTFLAFGMASSAFFPSFSLARELHSSTYSGSALGFMNMLNSVGGAILPYLIGIILDIYHPNLGKVAGYALTDYDHAFYLLLGCLLLALVLVPFIKETHCKMPDAK